MFREGVLCLFNNTEHFHPMLVPLVSRKPEEISAVNMHANVKWGALRILYKNRLQMCETGLLSGSSVKRFLFVTSVCEPLSAEEPCW